MDQTRGGGMIDPRLEKQDIIIREMQDKDIDTLIKIFCFPWLKKDLS